jgi:plastocyanin
MSLAAGDLDIAVEDSHSRALPEAAVYLTDGPNNGVPRVKEAQVDQKNRQFVPRISVVQIGTEVTFPNRDTIRHSVYSFSRPKTFQLKLFAGKTPDPILFDKLGIVDIGCNIHDEMAAWILVVDTPLFGKADNTGHFVFRHLKPGTYQLYAWYPGLHAASAPRTVIVDSSDSTGTTLHLDVVPIDDDTQR